jgi:hypothetical protein
MQTPKKTFLILLFSKREKVDDTEKPIDRCQLLPISICDCIIGNPTVSKEMSKTGAVFT